MVQNKIVARSVGAGKLKTLEYRFFRKIREKMSRYGSGKDKRQEIIRKYIQEISELENVNSSRAPFPQDYYIGVLQAGLDLVDNSNIDDDFIRGRFISILKVLFYALYKKISIKKYGHMMVSDSVFMEKVTQIPFLRYSGLGCASKVIYLNSGLPGMFKSYLGKKLGPHFDKLKQPYKIIPYNT